MSVQQNINSPSKADDKEQSRDHSTVLYPLDIYLPPQNMDKNQIMVSPLPKSEVLKQSEEVVLNCKAQLENNFLYLQPVESQPAHSRIHEQHVQHKKCGNKCTSRNHLKAIVQSPCYMLHTGTYNGKQKKPVSKTVLDSSFLKDGYMCPQNSFVSISECWDTIINNNLEREINQEYETEIDHQTTENTILHKKCDKPKVCQCQQLDPVSEPLVIKLPQSILKDKNLTESAHKSQGKTLEAFEQFQNIDKISVETNTEPGIPFRNTPNTAMFSMKVQQTSTRTDEKEISPRKNIQKTLQKQELPFVNIRPELSVQSGPTIHISGNGSKNVKQLRRNVDVTNIICDEENMNPAKGGINDEGNRFLLRNSTKQLEEAENSKVHIKIKSATKPKEDLLTKHEKFKHFVETFTTKLQRENSKIHKNQNKKLLFTLQSLSSNINELYENLQYAIPSYQDCIMSRIDRVTQLLEYELQDKDSVIDEHRCRLDEYFQQLTKSFQQEQYRRLWQKNVSVPPQDFFTFKSSLESRSNLRRQEQITQTGRPFQKETSIQSVTYMTKSKLVRKQDVIVNNKTFKHLHCMNTTSNSESEKPNIMKNTQETSSRRHVSKQVSFGENVKNLVSDSKSQLVLRNSVNKDTIQNAQGTTKQSVNETNNEIIEVNSNLQKSCINEDLNRTAGSWQAERMKVIQKIHEQLSEIELQFDSDKSVTDFSPANISTEGSVINAEVNHSRSTLGRDSEIKTTVMDTTQNQSRLDQANEDVEVQYADDWEVDDDDDDDVDDGQCSYDEGNANKNNEVSEEDNSSNDDGNIEIDCNNDSDGDGENDNNSNSNNEYKGTIDQDYVQGSLSVKSSGKSDILLSSKNSCEDCVPSMVTSVSLSMKKNQEDKEVLVKNKSDGVIDLAECEIISVYSSTLPVKSGTDVNKVYLHNKVNDTVKECVSAENSVMKKSETFKTNEIHIQTDVQNDYADGNIGTQIDVNDCTDELLKNIVREQEKLCTDCKNDKHFSSKINQSATNVTNQDCNCSNSLCGNINIMRTEKCTQTKTAYSHAPLQYETHDSAETVYEVSLPDCQTESAVILKTRGKSQNIQFVVNIPNDIGNRQITCSRQFCDNNLGNVQSNLQGSSSLAVSNVTGTQKSELIKDVIESTIEQVLKKYNEPTACTHLLKNESVHTERKTDEGLHNEEESETNNKYALTVPNVSLETNTEFWIKLREATDFLTNAASRHTEVRDNQIICSDNRTHDKTGLWSSKLETKETIGNDSNQKPECAYKTDENKIQHYDVETKYISNLTNSKQYSTLSSGSSMASTSSVSSSCSLLKTQSYHRTNKNSSVIPVATVSDGEICLTSSMCSCSIGEVKSQHCHYCQSKKCDTSHSEDLSIGELKKKSAINRNKKYYYGRKVIGNDDWNLNSKADTGIAPMSLIGESITQRYVQASTDDTSTASEGEINYGAEVVALENSKKANRKMKMQIKALPRHLSSSQAIHLEELTHLEYALTDRNKCNIKTLYTDHGKNKVTHNDACAVSDKSLYKYKSSLKTNVRSSAKSTSKSFAEVAKRIIEELKIEKMSSLQKDNTIQSDTSSKNKETKKEVMDLRQLKKHDNLLENLEPSFGVLTTHDTIIPSEVKEDLYATRNMPNSVSKSGDSSVKECLKFQYSEDCTSNRIEEIYEDNGTEQAGENCSTGEASKCSSNFKSSVDNTVRCIKKQHANLFVIRPANTEPNGNNCKILSSVAKQTSLQDCKLNRTDNIRNCSSIEHNLGEWHTKTVESKETLLKTSVNPTCCITNSSGPEDNEQQIPLHIVTAKSEHLVINFGNTNSCIEVFTESKDMSEPNTIGSLNDSSSSYDNLPGIYEIDFDSASKSSGELLPGIAAALDTMYYSEYEIDSSHEVDKSEEHIKDKETYFC